MFFFVHPAFLQVFWKQLDFYYFTVQNHLGWYDMTDTMKDSLRRDMNQAICIELREALDRNPGLNIRAVLDLAVTTFRRGSSCHNKLNSEMLDYLTKYNDLRDRDKVRHLTKEFTYP